MPPCTHSAQHRYLYRGCINDSLIRVPMRRVLNLRNIAIAALAAMTPVAARAQTQPPVERAIDRSLSWCAAPAAKPEWARQPIYLVLEEQRDSAEVVSSALRVPASHLAKLLGAVREQFRAATGRSETGHENGTALLAVDSRYGVPALRGNIAFQLRGNGAVDSLELRDVRDSTLFNQLAAALRAGTRPGALTAFGAASDIWPMMLKPAMNTSKKGATWAMFTMEVPRERLVTVTKRPSLSYPPEVRNWKADITLQFYVDTAGKPEPRTIVAVPSPDSIKWPSVESRLAYNQFVRVSRRGVERSLFTPAEFLGCRHRQLVVQPLVFQSAPPF